MNKITDHSEAYEIEDSIEKIENLSLLSHCVSENNNRDLGEYCIICMQGTIINLDTNTDTGNQGEYVIYIEEIPFLIKDCNCNFVVHSDCIEKWITNNSICPICRQNIINIKCIDDIHENKEQSESQVVYNPPPPYSIYHIPQQTILSDPYTNIVHTCIKIIFYLLFGYVVLSLITYYLR